jgi:hypothetical protein
MMQLTMLSSHSEEELRMKVEPYAFFPLNWQSQRQLSI